MSASIHRIRDFAPAAAPVAPVPARTAIGLYPGDAALIASLRLCGVQRVLGIFDAAAWTVTCANAGLYRMPLHGRVRADMSLIKAEAHALAMQADDRFWALGDPRPGFGRRLMREYAASGRLPGILWPHHEPSNGPHDEWLEVDFPRPPASMLPNLQRASLAGVSLWAACPAGAIRVREDATADRAEFSAVAALLDPIVYGLHQPTQRVAPLGCYAQSDDDPEELKSLVAVLTALTVYL